MVMHGVIWCTDVARTMTLYNSSIYHMRSRSILIRDYFSSSHYYKTYKDNLSIFRILIYAVNLATLSEQSDLIIRVNVWDGRFDLAVTVFMLHSWSINS